MKKKVKILVDVLAIVLVVCAVAGVAVALGKSNDTTTTDCPDDLHFLNDKFVCKNCKQQAPQSISLSEYFVTTYFVEGDGCQLVCNFLPENTTLTKITWSSSDEEVATVDENGYVTYKGNGVARIYATPVTGEEHGHFCTFTLTRRSPDLSLTFERDQYYIDTSYLESDMLRKASVRIYDNGSADMPADGNFVWASSDESVVRVLEGAKRVRTILYVGEGSATVTATASNGAVATANVYVGPRLKLYVNGTTSRVPAHIGDKLNIYCDWLPERCIGDFVSKFTSSDVDVATVDDDGIVTVVGYGTVTFKADVYKSSTAVDTEITVEIVSPAVASVRLNNSDKGGVLVSDESYIGNLTMAANNAPSDIANEYPNTVQLAASVFPWYAEDKNVVWTSSDAAVATVNECGLITAVGGGTATITATAHNGVSSSCTVSSTLFVESVTLTGYEIVDFVPNADFCRMFVGDNMQLNKQILPANNNDTRLDAAVWRSSNKNVATVDENGLVTAIGAGEVTISYTPFYVIGNRNYLAAVKIVVCEPIETIILGVDENMLDYGVGRQKLDDNHYTLGLSDSMTLVTRITGSNAETDGIKDRLHYSSSNSAAVRVSSSGVISAKSLGTADITVTTDSGKTASVTITVLFYAQEMSVNDLTVCVGDSVVLPLVIVPENATPYLGISYNSQFVDITSDYEFDRGYLYLGQQITITAKQVGTCTVTLDACGPFDANDPTTKASVTFTVIVVDAPASFDACSWSQIAEYSASGQAAEMFSVGDEKQVTLTNGEVVTFVILDFNHDIDEYGHFAGLTLGIKDLYSATSAMNTTNSNTASSVMSATLSGIYNLLPEDLQAVIKSVRKETSAGGKSSMINACLTKLFLFSEKEVFGTFAGSFDGEGTQYTYFSQNTNRALTINGTASNWLLRSPTKSSYTTFRGVYQSGVVGNINANVEAGICFGFCI